MEEKQKTFLIGVNNICKYFDFGRDFFFECIKLGMPHTVFNNRHMVTVKKVEEWMEGQMEPKSNNAGIDCKMSLKKIEKFTQPKKLTEMFIGNEFTKIVHLPRCEWVFRMHPDHFIKFDFLHDALSNDFEECKSCLGEVGRFYEVEQIKKEIKNEFFKECICCKEHRGVQRAHMRPKKFGDGKTMPLCPRCHWNYDHNLLNQSEKEKISNWIDAENKNEIQRIDRGYLVSSEDARYL